MQLVRRLLDAPGGCQRGAAAIGRIDKAVDRMAGLLVFPGLAALFLVGVVLLTGCAGDSAGGQEGATASQDATLPTITTVAATTASSAAPLTSDTTGGSSDSTTTSTSVWVLATTSKTLSQLAEELERGLQGTGVPAYAPSELPAGYMVAEIVRTLSGPSENPVFWEMSGPRPGPRAAGYRVFFSNGSTWARLDVNPQADHGNVQWKGTGVRWNGRELTCLEYPDAYWVRVPVPEDTVVEVWGPPEAREDVLSLASHVSEVGKAEGP